VALWNGVQGIRQTEERYVGCCVPAGTTYTGQDLVKVAEFVGSNPYVLNEDDRISSFSKFLAWTHLKEMTPKGQQFSKLDKDSEKFQEAMKAARSFASKSTASENTFYLFNHKCKEGLTEVTDPILKSWRCDSHTMWKVRFEVETSLKYYDSLASQNQQWQAIKDKMKKDNEKVDELIAKAEEQHGKLYAKGKEMVDKQTKIVEGLKEDLANKNLPM